MAHFPSQLPIPPRHCRFIGLFSEDGRIFFFLPPGSDSQTLMECNSHSFSCFKPKLTALSVSFGVHSTN